MPVKIDTRFGALLRYDPKSKIFTGRLTPGPSHNGWMVGSLIGGAKVVASSNGEVFLEMVDPSYGALMKFADALGGSDSQKALSGMASQMRGTDKLVAMLSIKE